MRNTVFLILLDGLGNGVLTSSMIRFLPHGASNLSQTVAVFIYGLGATAIIYHSTRISDYIQYRTEALIVILMFALLCLTAIFSS